MELNKRELAECFGIAEDTITEWQANGCPVVSLSRGTKGNRYDTAAVYHWRLDRAEQRGGVTNLEQERTRLTCAQADRAELESKELAGELVRAEAVVAAWSERFASARAKLIAWPSKVAQRLAAPGKAAELQAMAQESVYEVLDELAGNGLPKRNGAHRGAHDAGVEAAAAADDQRVGGQAPKAVGRVKRGTGKVADVAG